MNDYKEMYYVLFNKMTDIISDLQDVQIKAEELYISSELQQKTTEFSAMKIKDYNSKGYTP